MWTKRKPRWCKACRSSDARKASIDEAGRFVLDEETSSYAWTSRRLKSTVYNKPLASDKYVNGYEDSEGVHSGHRGMNVLRTDGSVRFVPASSLSPATMLPDDLTR